MFSIARSQRGVSVGVLFAARAQEAPDAEADQDDPERKLEPDTAVFALPEPDANTAPRPASSATSKILIAPVHART